MMKFSSKEYRSDKKTKWSLVIPFSFWTVGFACMTGIYAYNITTLDNLMFKDVIAVFTLLLIVSVAINYLRWQFVGQEIMTFTNDYIEIKNLGTFFSFYQKISYDEVEKITVDIDEHRPFFIQYWDIGGGKIVIEYLGRNRRFGKDLGNIEAGLMMKSMRRELQIRKNASAQAAYAASGE